MTQICTKQSFLRPQTAAQLKNDDDISLQLDTLNIRPLSAHTIPAGQNGTFLRDDGVTNGDKDYSVTERLRIDPVLDQFSFRARSARKKKLNVKTVTEAWLKKTRSEVEEIHPFIDQSLDGLDNSDEYDTDIEEDFSKPESKYRADPTGIYRYEKKCIKSGILPISYLKRQMGRRNVKMRHRYLGNEAMKAIAEALKVNTVTENLDLSDNYIQCNGASYIAEMLLDNMFIIHMNLSDNFIGTRGVEALSVMLQNNTTLKTLSLSGNQLCDRDAGVLVDGLMNNDTLQSLDLSNNNIGELGGIYLGKVLAINEGLFDLDLSWNCITRKGAVGVVQALKSNKVLEVLDISWNGIGLEGAAALQKYLPGNTKLRILDLTNNRLTEEAAKKLAIGLKKNKVLETIILNLNAMKNEGVEAILKAAQVNLVLKLISLEEVGLNASNYNLMQELCEDRDLTILHGGTGGYKRPTAIKSTLNIFQVFLEKNGSDLKRALEQQDKGEIGALCSDEVKFCLKDTGLRLTNRQLDMLIEEIDASTAGNFKYSDILSINAVTEHFKRKYSNSLSDNESINSMTKHMARHVTTFT
ncbi:hypothetical protein SNE40_015745 [Patella caerulea]|uniref:Uncharacterized protein n=1 Tax=Patella caerulea TaxID=87958 RepID=A0AAN8JMU3_PATCE